MKTKSTFQTARTFTTSTILLAVTALALLASSGSRAAESCTVATYWRVASGDWFVGSNWTNDVPNASKSAQVNNGGTATIGPTPAAVSCDLTMGANATESGRVVVDNGSYNIQFDAAVGQSGRGVLTIKNGGTVHAVSAAIATVQTNPSSNGTVSVNGGSFTLSGGIYVGGDVGGRGGTGLLTVTNSGTVTAASVHVWQSGTLAGNSTVSTTNGITTVDGTVAPNGGGTTLTFDGDLQLNGDATTQCNVTPQDPSTTPQVSVSAQVSLGGRLSVTMTGDFSSAPTRFTLLYADTFDVNHNTFDSKSINYPTGQGWTPQITYDYTGGHVNIYLDRVYDTNP